MSTIIYYAVIFNNLLAKVNYTKWQSNNILSKYSIRSTLLYYSIMILYSTVAVLIELCESIRWMAASHYSRIIRQGVMRSTVNKKICNIARIQSEILDVVKMTCKNFHERVFQTNPCAPGGPRDHIEPENGLPQLKARKTFTASTTTPYWTRRVVTRTRVPGEGGGRKGQTGCREVET